jgi:hydroxypyruvate reductase
MDHIDLAAAARRIFAQTLEQCRVETALGARISRDTRRKPYAFTIQGQGHSSIEVDLTAVKSLVVIAAGKGAATMLRGLLDKIAIPGGCRLEGVLIAPERPRDLPEDVQYFGGGHPLPTQASFDGAKAALSLLKRTSGKEAFCFFLISGGASAMMELPLDETISLEDTVAFYRALVHSGASIAEINCVRKHFSAIKGGRLGLAAAALPNLTIVVSDVPSGHLNSLASGPTVPDRSTVKQCHEILHRYGLMEQFPDSVRSYFGSSHLSETPKQSAFAAHVVTLLSDVELAEAARRTAESLGFTAVVDNSCDEWDYRDAAQYLLQRFRELRKLHNRLCLISSGEVTVKISGQSGVGGRNQHFALYTATLLEPSDRSTVVFSAGSDGIDGNSSFAGAVLDDDLLHGIHGVNSDEVQAALHQFDSSPLVERLNAHVVTGPTGNNLRDLRLLLCT